MTEQEYNNSQIDKQNQVDGIALEEQEESELFTEGYRDAQAKKAMRYSILEHPQYFEGYLKGLIEMPVKLSADGTHYLIDYAAKNPQPPLPSNGFAFNWADNPDDYANCW